MLLCIPFHVMLSAPLLPTPVDPHLIPRVDPPPVDINPECRDDDDCAGANEVCCPTKKVCEVPVPENPQLCGENLASSIDTAML